MKPKTKEERKVLLLAKELRPISSEAEKYGFDLFTKEGLYWKNGKAWCKCCGHESRIDVQAFPTNKDTIDYVCPHCGKNIKLKNAGRRRNLTMSEPLYYVTIETHKGYQVFRVFYMTRDNKNNQATFYKSNEVFHIWIREDGKETIIGRDYNVSFYGISFSWKNESEMSVKKRAGGQNYYYRGDIYSLEGCYFYPRAKVTKLLKRNGWRNTILNRTNIDPARLSRELIQMQTPLYEELTKHKQYSLLAYMMNVYDGYRVSRDYVHAVRICERNKYIIKDANLWLDYLKLLTFFHLDTHNAKYVCPKNLKKEHDRLSERKQRIEAENREKEKRQNIQKNEADYKMFRGRFFGVTFGSPDIIISPLKSVAEFYEEGDVMHHCVASCSYFDKRTHPNSLILSARDKAGRRIETIEVDIKNWKVAQSRAMYNKKSELHDEIVNLVNSNMPIIRKAAYTKEK